MKNNLSLYIKLLRKKIWDMKLKTKIRIFLFMTSILTIIGVGTYSYYIARHELIQNSKDAVRSIEKQGSRNLDDRINAFQDVSYRILQTSNIAELLEYSTEEAARNRTMNEGLPAVISQQSSLLSYTKYALLRPNSGEVYDYYKSGQKRLSSDKQNELLDILEQSVDKNHPICWTTYGNNVYFVRRIITPYFQDKGLLCFSIDESFFEFMSDDVEYLNDDHIIVLNRENEILKCQDEKRAKMILPEIIGNKEYHYYIYNLTRELLDDIYTVTVIDTPDNGWTIVSYFSHSVLLKGIRQIYVGMMGFLVVVILFVVLITAVISKSITKNVTLIEQGMVQYEAGHFEYRISPSSYDEVGLLGLQLNYMAMKISELIQMLHLEEEEKKKLEIETLQAQINPHFLYNTLGSLKWAAYKQGQKELAASLDALVHLLRFTIKKSGGLVSVWEEIEYIQNYISIEKVRYGDEFEIYYDINDSVKELQIPGFILQPLVENCFIHGLDFAAGKGRIHIKAYRQQGYLYIEVQDNGIGIEEEKIKELLKPDNGKKQYKGFNSIGLKIVDKRLHEIYGSRYSTEIRSAKGEGTDILLRIPLEEEKDEMESIDC